MCFSKDGLCFGELIWKVGSKGGFTLPNLVGAFPGFLISIVYFVKSVYRPKFALASTPCCKLKLPYLQALSSTHSGGRAADSSAIACQSLFLWSVSSTRWASDDMFFHSILHLLLDGVRLILYVSEKLYGEVQVALCLWFFPILVEAFLCLGCISPLGASFVGI